MSNPDVTNRFHGGNPESAEANPDRSRKQNLRLQVERLLRRAGPRGATSDEIEQTLDLTHQTASARLTELKIRGYVVPGERRITRSGRYARALVHVDCHGGFDGY